MKTPAPTPPKPKLTKKEQQKAVVDRFKAEHAASLQEAREKVKLLWYCRTDDGWRYLHDAPDVRKQYPNGRLMIRERVHGRRIYTPVQDAQNPSAEIDKAMIRVMYPKRPETPVADPDSLAAAIADYIADRKAHNKLEAAENARVVLNEFRELLPTVKTVRGIAKEHLTQFSEKLRDPERIPKQSPRTISNKYNRLRSFLKFAGHDVKLSKDDRPKYDKKLPTTYTKAETQALLQHADDYMRVAITMGLHLGLREQELMHAEFSDIHRDDKTFRVCSKPAYGFKVKDSEERDVPISSALFALLDEWQHKRKHDGLILGIGTEHDRPNGHLLRWLQRVAKKAHVQDASLHKMRRSWLTALVRSKAVDLRTAQDFAGHSDLASTMRYLKPASAAEMQHKIDSIF
jgi:integrase